MREHPSATIEIEIREKINTEGNRGDEDEHSEANESVDPGGLRVGCRCHRMRDAEAIALVRVV
jgi:hypothetical protein